jgi:NPCBM/NEW2 domain
MTRGAVRTAAVRSRGTRGPSHHTARMAGALIRALAACATTALVVSACGTSSSVQPGHSSAAAATRASGATPSSSPASPAAAPPTASPGSTNTPQYLASFSPVSGSGDLFTGSANVNGQYYADSVILELNPGPANVGYNLERHWQTLNVTVGLEDDSPENEKVQFQAIGDGHTIYNHVFELGQSEHLSLDVSGVLRLDLVVTLASNFVGQTEAVWGNASVTG